MRRLFLVIVDAVLLFAAAFTAAHIRFGSEISDVLFNQRGWMKIVMLTVIIQLAFYLFDLYDLPATRRYRRVIINIVIALASLRSSYPFCITSCRRCSWGAGSF